MITTMVFKRASFFALFILGFLLQIQSQIYNPVSWNHSVEKISNDEFDIVFTANIEGKWHMYSQNLPSDDGPIATSFAFADNKNIKLLGKTRESKAKKEYDPVFQMELAFFEKKAEFRQKVKLLADKTTFNAEVEFMVCDDSKCLAPEIIEFEIPLQKEEKVKTSKEESPAKSTEKTDFTNDKIKTSEVENHIVEPVKWQFKLHKLNETTYEVHAIANIEEHWHLYSSYLPEDDGPIATEFTIDESPSIQAVSEIKEIGNLIKAFDNNFQMELMYFENTVTFVREVKVEANAKNISGLVYFMVCDDKRCLAPEEVAFELSIESAEATASQLEATPNTKDDDSNRSGFALFILGVLGGFAALVTPCVFPMVPLTVSFFTKQSKSRVKGQINAALYGFFIIAIYVLLSLPFHLIDSLDPDILNNISTNPVLNLSFFVIFIVFAISFFGAFEITIPSSWINKADSASDVGGVIGIFFMSVTLALVSFSCTGPILGALLGSTLSTDGGATALTLGMLGFGVGLALPFGLFALFPGWLNTLPKSGGWLNVVKVCLGFLELALALKFLSNADLVLQLGLLQRELFIAIWVGIFLLMALYLLGVFRLPHDSPVDKISVGRLMVATLTLVFTIYLIPGMWGAPLKLISGFPPPTFYSESPNGIGSSATVTSSSAEIAPKHSSAHCPHNLNCFHDYDEALAYAKKVNKPLMLDFTGWACVNCRRMEEQVWSDQRVLDRLASNVVLVSLYVDERTKLPDDEQIEVTVGNKTRKLKTIGNKWSYFQTSRFQNNSQPYYVILDHEGNQLHEAADYDPDITKFIDWLDRGVQLFKQKSK